MDFGKLPLEQLPQVDFSVPPLRAADAAFLQAVRPQSSAPTKLHIYIGCPVWSNKAWEGILFPPKTPAARYLEHYSRYFNTVELNATHYALPAWSQIEKWLHSVPRDFRFCPKFPQSISHEAQLLNCAAASALFFEVAAAFGEHLGTTFLQMPPTFAPNQAGVLEQYLSAIPPTLPVALELRHPAWFAEEQQEKTVHLLRNAGIAWLTTDTAGVRAAAHGRLTTSTAMVRFVGNGGAAGESARLGAWAQRVVEWQAAGLQTLYFFIHQPEEKINPYSAQYFIEQLQENGSISVSFLDFWQDDSAVQGSLF